MASGASRDKDLKRFSRGQIGPASACGEGVYESLSQVSIPANAESRGCSDSATCTRPALNGRAKWDFGGVFALQTARVDD